MEPAGVGKLPGAAGEHNPEALIYVADSQLLTPANLQQIAAQRLRFISRLPATYKLEAQLKGAAWEPWVRGEWQEVGALAERPQAERYWIWETEAVLYGRRYRFVLVRSTARDRRREKALEREVADEAKRLTQAAEALARQRFACEADAQAPRDRFWAEQAPVLHTVTAEVQREPVIHRPRGRPRKDAPPPPAQTHSRVVVTVQPPSPERLHEEMDKRAPFVLITNVPAEELPAREVLATYKA